MSTTSPAKGDGAGNPSSIQLQQQQQPVPPPIPPQQLQASNSSSGSPSTTPAIHNSTSQHPPLFLKPHPTILPTPYSASNTNTTSSAITTTSTSSSNSAGSPPKLPLTTTHASSTSPSTTSANPHFVKGQGVREPLPTDVICGRGKMTASHPANRRFRELVDSHKASYQNSKRRDEKTRITCELVDKLRGEGRFVLFDPNTKLWHEVSEEYAREKVSHSLRSRSSTEQRIANAASNSIKMLNHAHVVQHTTNTDVTTTETVVSIAPRGNQLLVPKKLESPPKAANIPKSKQQPQLVTSSKPAKQAALLRKKKVPLKAQRVAKHLKPGLDEIVKRLIQDQQKLLRMMIQKETDRFTSAAAMSTTSSQPPPMPLSYKAEASAVNKLHASLPKLGAETTDTVMSVHPTSAAGEANASNPSVDPKASPKSETSASMPTVAA